MAPRRCAASSKVFGPLPASARRRRRALARGLEVSAAHQAQGRSAAGEVAVFVYPLPPPNSPDNPALNVLTELLTSGKVDQFREDLVQRGTRRSRPEARR
jgi:hypothetical protein